MTAGRTIDLLLAGIISALVGVAFLLTPSGSGLALPRGAPLGTLCWLKAGSGFDCPFCGLTRSFVALLHGDLRGSLACHPAGPLLGAAMLLLLAAIVVQAIRCRPPVSEKRGFVRSFEVMALVCVMLGLLRGW